MVSNLIKEFEKIEISNISDKSIKNIKAGFLKYKSIMESVNKVDISTDMEFQKKFNGFYRLRQRKTDFYMDFYKFFETCKNNKNITFQEILNNIYTITGRIEKSFSSKIMATINPDYPIWDRYVLQNIGLKEPSYSDKDRLNKYIMLYDRIVEFYKEYSKTGHCKLLLNFFDKICPDSNITETKKIDFIIWQTR